MQDAFKYAVLMGRMLDLLQRGGDATSDDHRTALHALVDLSASRSATIRLAGNVLTVESQDVPKDTPYVDGLKTMLTAHGIAEVHVANGTSAVDLIHFLRALTASPSGAQGSQIDVRLQRAKVTTISIVTADQAAASHERRGVRVTEALKAAGIIDRSKPAASGDRELGVLRPEKGAAFDEMRRHQRATANTLAGALERLDERLDPTAFRGRLEPVQAGITRAVKAREIDKALEAVVQLIRLEANADSEDIQRSYSIALRRILTEDNLQHFTPRLLDDVYASDVVVIMRRAGAQGTKILLDKLVVAPTQAERKAYLRALRQVEEGLEVVTSLLNHHEWYVVRNAADLVGELQISEAAAELGKVIRHADPRVRQAAGVSLARLGTSTAAQHLRRVFYDDDPKVRLAVVKAVGGRGLSGLAMPLMSAADSEEDPKVQAEYYRALGRIGTPDAAQALHKVAMASGGLFGRRTSPTQIAAVEALGQAGAVAIAALESLIKQRSGDIRKAAKAALQRVRATSE